MRGKGRDTTGVGPSIDQPLHPCLAVSGGDSEDRGSSGCTTTRRVATESASMLEQKDRNRGTHRVGPEQQKELKAMPDLDLLSRIVEVADQEKELRAIEGRLTPAKPDVDRLEEIEVELDQCRDLLNQRGALREFGLDPDRARVRDEDTVENYEQ